MARDARAHGVEALSNRVEVADAGAVDAAAERIEHELGHVDVCVNGAIKKAPLNGLTA